MVNYRKILQLDADKNVSVRDLLSSAHCSYHSYTNDTAAYRKAKFRCRSYRILTRKKRFILSSAAGLS